MAQISKTVDRREIARFEALSAGWWDADGPFKALHRLNPTRLRFVRDLTCGYFGRNPRDETPLAGLSVLDIGCGGGLLSEPLARLGAEVAGIDAAERSIRIATRHAEQSGLGIDYRVATAEALSATGVSFDLVLNMEVIEHVADRQPFLSASAALVAPGGLYFAATLNRTAKSFAFAIVGAEYLLRWLPRGTHDWHRFVTPHELTRALTALGLDLIEICGVRYHPLLDDWALERSDLAVNYMGCWRKTAKKA